jgi:hypothetical protein
MKKKICKIYIAKNDKWTEEDVEYSGIISEHLGNISKDAPIKFDEALERDKVKALLCKVRGYCSTEFESRFNKPVKHCEYVSYFTERLEMLQLTLVIGRIYAKYLENVTSIIKRSKTIPEFRKIF